MSWEVSMRVRIEYADMAKMNRIRAWARRNNCRVEASRYARDAYEGVVIVPSPWNEGNSAMEAKVVALKALIAAKDPQPSSR